jgi:hypothetical protein
VNNKKTLINFIVDYGLLRRVEDFRFKNRFQNRAAAIKWLLEWALKQKPSVTQYQEETAPTEVRSAEAPTRNPMAESVAERKPTAAPSWGSPSPVSPSQSSPSLASVVQALRDQGYEVGEIASHPDGQERILVRSKDRSAWVNAVQELQDLAASRITLPEISTRRASGK